MRCAQKAAEAHKLPVALMAAKDEVSGIICCQSALG
jgi:hypothetical protein